MEFELGGRRPKVHPDAYIAPTAVLIGDVEIGANASIWFGAVLRGDEASITVGEGANVQDNVVLHVSTNLPTIIERDATIGHSAQLRPQRTGSPLSRGGATCRSNVGICLAITSASACGGPLYGTCASLMPAAEQNTSVTR